MARLYVSGLVSSQRVDQSFSLNMQRRTRVILFMFAFSSRGAKEYRWISTHCENTCNENKTSTFCISDDDDWQFAPQKPV